MGYSFKESTAFPKIFSWFRVLRIRNFQEGNVVLTGWGERQRNTGLVH